MRSIVPIVALIVAQAVCSPLSFALPEGFFTGDKLASVVQEAGCAPDKIEIREEFLRSPAGQMPDRLLYCKDDCGVGGCTYFIFLRNQEAFDLYRYAGSITGRYSVLQSIHSNYRDLKVEQRMGSDKKAEQTLHWLAGRYVE
jgi:hypothetical protein